MERRSTNPAPRRPDRAPAPDPVAARPRTLLEREDVAFVPRLAIVVVSLATVLSVALRPGERDFDLPLMIWSGILAAGAAATAAPRARRRLGVLAGRATSFTALGPMIAVALGVIAWPDGGVNGPFFTSTVALAAFIGLVLPRGPAALTMLPLLAIVAVLELHVPPSTVLGAVSTPVLIVAAWVLGRSGHRFHAQITRKALVRSRSDELTRTLNRRGFFEQFEHQLHASRRDVTALSVLLVDLDGFKHVNDEHGHAAGDELLSWVGARLAEVLPDDATAGRIGGDEFAVLMPGGELGAHRLAERLRRALAPRIGASIGHATATPADTHTADELLRIADTRMYAVKHRTTVAPPSQPAADRDGDRLAAAARRRPRAESPAVGYADVRARCPRKEGSSRPVGVQQIDIIGALTIVVAGLVMVPVQLSYPGDSAADRALELVFAPWLLVNLIVIGSMLHLRGSDHPRAGRILYLATSVLLGSALAITMLAGPGDGIASPLVGTVFLKLILDGVSTSTRRSRENAFVICGWWAVAAIAGPSDALWLVPFQLSMMVASRAIGVLSRAAFAETARRITRLAQADALTGLANRAGWEAELGTVLEQAAAGRPLTLLAVDLDGFKAVNDRLGHEAGDELLRGVAGVLRAELSDAYVIARVGGDEFVAAMPLADDAAAQPVVKRLCAALTPVAAGSIGWAVYGADGTTLDALAKVSDHRSYEAKRARRRAAAGT